MTVQKVSSPNARGRKKESFRGGPGELILVGSADIRQHASCKLRAASCPWWYSVGPIWSVLPSVIGRYAGLVGTLSQLRYPGCKKVARYLISLLKLYCMHEQIGFSCWRKDTFFY